MQKGDKAQAAGRINNTATSRHDFITEPVEIALNTNSHEEYSRPGQKEAIFIPPDGVKKWLKWCASLGTPLADGYV